MDLWMLSRAGTAAKDVINGFEGYDFVLATTSVYNLWLYDLCDVYLVPVLLFILLFQALS